MSNTEQLLPTWGRERRDAGHYLVAMSILNDHDWFRNHVTLGSDDITNPERIDVQALDDYSWSSGERTLVNLFLTFAGWPRTVTVRDIFNLDEKNKNAVGNALSIACRPNGTWRLDTVSYDEAF